MSAAAHLLRRRSFFLSQHRQKIRALSIPFLGAPGQSRNPSGSSAFRGRKFSATSTAKPPEISAAENPNSSNNRLLKVTTAGAALFLLSSGAWYVTRDEYPQVQHFGLPQIFHGNYQEEKVPTQIDEKSLIFVQSGDIQEEEAREEILNDIGEAHSHEREHINDGQQVYEVADNSAVSKEAVESIKGHFEKSSPEPPVVNNEIPAVLESSSRQEETPKEQIRPPSDSGPENPLPSEEAHQEHALIVEEGESEEQGVVETLVDAVKDKVSAVKEYLFDEANDVSKESDEALDKGDDVREAILLVGGGDDGGEEILLIREKLREENPEMFYLETPTDDKHGTQKDGVELMEELALLQDKLREEHLQEEKDVADVVGVDVLVGAIHTAAQLQAEVDSRTYQEQLHKLQEAHKSELQDYQAKIFAYAEGTDQLEKELKIEKKEAAAALKLQEQRAEERLQYHLKKQEEDAAKEKEKVQLLEKALAEASLTREKADHLDDLHSVQLQVNALRTAFYTRSEEARVSHTAHKLAMGAFALEDAVEKGEAVEKEADLLIASAGGPGVDPLVDAVVSSLPSEALTVGTGTRAQLHQKFTTLKGSLRELALMPSGGGGVLSHFLARVAANLKISEKGSDDVTNGGIEMVIGRVERLLAEEKLVEAAMVLEIGVKGTAAEGLAVEWAKQARNRAVIEQGLLALKAHVIAVASGVQTVRDDLEAGFFHRFFPAGYSREVLDARQLQ